MKHRKTVAPSDQKRLRDAIAPALTADEDEERINDVDRYFKKSCLSLGRKLYESGHACGVKEELLSATGPSDIVGKCIAQMKFVDYEVRLQVGLVVSPLQPWLCCSPDGIVQGNEAIHLVEIKCPYSLKDSLLIDHQNLVSFVPYVVYENGRLSLKRGHQYYTQLRMAGKYTRQRSLGNYLCIQPELSTDWQNGQSGRAKTSGKTFVSEDDITWFNPVEEA
ncbi:hypothetical protein HPB49_008133 [Dermacentor silvarum]|uniref:Uncharacterized protein n=1 Tax=Dermacentor silvarum TaxID=543639 RepID=A0ACB8C895_DERSI|nr:hypothetical protein HPB49_008133 [Dermacentor silvarum]